MEHLNVKNICNCRCLDPVSDYCALEPKLSSLLDNNLGSAAFSELKSKFDTKSDVLAAIKLLREVKLSTTASNETNHPGEEFDELETTNSENKDGKAFKSPLEQRPLTELLNKNQHKTFLGKRIFIF